MGKSLSILVDNLAEGIHENKCKQNMETQNSKRVELNTKIVSAVTNTETLKMI